MKLLFIFPFFIFFLFFAFSIPAFAARLPHIEITEQEWKQPADQVLQQLSEHQENFSFKQFKQRERFWNYVVKLKLALLQLQAQNSENIDQEADRLAKQIIARTYELSQEYKIVGWPYLQNFLIKTHVRKRGYCYHYTEDLLKTLAPQTWTYFDLSWGEAAENTWHESNALVVTASEQPFEKGLLVDAWRKGSRPFWVPVAQDKRWHWKPFDYQRLRPEH